MIDGTSHRNSASVALALLGLTLSVGLGGCAGLGDSMASSAFVDPAKYDLYDCKQLAATRTSLAAQSDAQQKLIDKANTGAGGAVVGEMVYRSEYTAIRAQLKLANNKWDSGRCAEATPAVAAVPTPPVVAAPVAPAKPRR